MNLTETLLRVDHYNQTRTQPPHLHFTFRIRTTHYRNSTSFLKNLPTQKSYAFYLVNSLAFLNLPPHEFSLPKTQHTSPAAKLHRKLCARTLRAPIHAASSRAYYAAHMRFSAVSLIRAVSRFPEKKGRDP